MDTNDYPACARTYATLRIYPARIDPTEVTSRLGIEPSEWQRLGDITNPGSKIPRFAELHGWFLTTKEVVKSRDVRKHLDWLLERISTKAEAIRSLQSDECRMDVSCYWLSQWGHGGPALSPQQMSLLAQLGLELWFDVYFGGDGKD